MCDEHPAEFVRCVANLIPKELLLQVSTKEATQWVINAQPMSVEEWAAEHGIKTIEHTNSLNGEKPSGYS